MQVPMRAGVHAGAQVHGGGGAAVLLASCAAFALSALAWAVGRDLLATWCFLGFLSFLCVVGTLVPCASVELFPDPFLFEWFVTMFALNQLWLLAASGGIHSATYSRSVTKFIHSHLMCAPAGGAATCSAPARACTTLPGGLYVEGPENTARLRSTDNLNNVLAGQAYLHKATGVLIPATGRAYTCAERATCSAKCTRPALGNCWLFVDWVCRMYPHATDKCSVLSGWQVDGQ
mmetsp:Transcript_21679/g.55200  ORF Transcript_21679/g.55200 Transcript_21679/m.55200 type:complete len:233 (+) Transcript_21679:1127-1825(+)